MSKMHVLVVLYVGLILAGCSPEKRSPPVTYPDACGSHVECFNKSLLNLADAKKLLETAQQQAVFLVPPGTVVAFAGSQAPDGWLLCDGRSLDKSDPLYKRLFDAIGTSYGGDANPTFQIPDYRGVFLRGVDGGTKKDPDASSRLAMGKSGTGNSGNAVGSYESDQLASHDHMIPTAFAEAAGGGAFQGDALSSNSNQRQRPQYNTRPAGGAETRPKNVSVYYLIKL